MRKGYIHTLEASIATVILLTFVIAVLPYIAPEDTSAQTTRTIIRGALEVLEKNGDLRDNAVNEDLSAIKTELQTIVPSRINFTVGISDVDITSGSVTTSGQVFVNYTVNTSTMDFVFFKLKMSDATDPRFSINGTSIWNGSGNYIGENKEWQLADYSEAGTNQINITVTAESTIKYIVEVGNSLDLETIPGNKTINTVNYIVSGVNSTFKPTEIRVYAWR